MTLEENVMAQLKEAMKSRDQAALRALRAIKAEILLYKTSGTSKALDTATEIQLLQKMIKQRKESQAIFEQEGRDDLAAREHEEIDVITRFLPEQLSREELQQFVGALVAELGAAGMKDMGRVMGEATKRLAGKAESKDVADLVKQALQP